MASPPDHWNPVIINALVLYVGFWGIPKGQLRSFWMALLRSVTVPLFLPHVFPLGPYPALEKGVRNGSLILLDILLNLVVIWENGSGLPGRHVQVYFHVTIRIQGIQRRGDGKDCVPLPPKEWGVRSASLAIFFLDLGLGEVLHRERLEPAFGGNRLRVFFRLVTPAEGVSALALTHFN